MRPRPLVLVLAVLLAALHPVHAGAQRVSARATVDRNPVGVDQPFTVTIYVSGVQNLDVQPEVPALSGFARFLGSSSSSSMQVVNGRSSVTYAIQYRYLAMREGTFEIPALQVRAGGRTLTTDPVQIRVSATAPRTNPGEEGVVVGGDELFIEAQVSDRRVYVNEPLTVAFRLFTRVGVESVNVVSPPDTEGFWVEEIPLRGQPVPESVTRDGVQYTSAVLRRFALFPTGAGTRTIGPFTVDARVRVRRRGNGLLDDFFGNGILGRVASIPISTQPVEITVEPLPPGQPDSFTGLVGRLDASATLDRAEVEAGDALTLTLRVEGEGNIGALQPPTLELPAAFEVFDPEVSETIVRGGGTVRGSKTFAYVLIPRAPGDHVIPAVEFAYFDPATEAYALAGTEPLNVAVTGQPIAPGAPRSGVESVREDIRFIRLGPPRLERERSLVASPLFWAVALLPLFALGGAVALRRHQERLEGDVAYARGRRAGRLARKRLKRARELASEERREAFYAETSRALRGLIADKLNVSEAGLMSERIEADLRDRGVGKGTVREVLDCLAECDARRFAPGGDALEADAFLDRVGRVMERVQEECDS